MLKTKHIKKKERQNKKKLEKENRKIKFNVFSILLESTMSAKEHANTVRQWKREKHLLLNQLGNHSFLLE